MCVQATKQRCLGLVFVCVRVVGFRLAELRYCGVLLCSKELTYYRSHGSRFFGAYEHFRAEIRCERQCVLLG
jgi:hypothetical protein